MGVSRKLGIGLVSDNGSSAGLFGTNSVQHESINAIGRGGNILGWIKMRGSKGAKVAVDLHDGRLFWLDLQYVNETAWDCTDDISLVPQDAILETGLCVDGLVIQ